MIALALVLILGIVAILIDGGRIKGNRRDKWDIF